MYENKLSTIYLPQNLKSTSVNKFAYNPIPQKNFLSGLQNARKLLEGLERSFSKSAKYESELLRCKSTHSHLHDDQWWSSDQSIDKDTKIVKKESKETTSNRVDLTESWSTMSIVCLQYQYDELSKRYEALLQAYHERSDEVSERDASLARLRERTRESHAQLAHAHKTLLSVGEKYLSIWKNKQQQKRKYEKRINRLKATVRGMMAMCEHARLELDSRIARFMEKEKSAPNAQLLAEIRKCNLLYLENLRLKAHIENMTPGLIFLEKPKI